MTGVWIYTLELDGSFELLHLQKWRRFYMKGPLNSQVVWPSDGSQTKDLGASVEVVSVFRIEPVSQPSVYASLIFFGFGVFSPEEVRISPSVLAFVAGEVENHPWRHCGNILQGLVSKYQKSRATGYLLPREASRLFTRVYLPVLHPPKGV
ncbi:hypothetical protein ASPBRDRAFT_43033, partial [Aspergillus brasiliensis CBS 101740]